MSGYEIFALVASATAAGAINAIAGGGTLLTFPTLLLCGTPPIVANATSTLALVIGTTGSIFGFRQYIAAIKKWLVRFVPVSLVGGWLGSWLLTHTSDKFFARLVPFLILFATVLFLAQNLFRQMAKREAATPHKGQTGLWVAIVFQFAVAVYGGYFGAGIGILMLASLGFLGLSNIHEMNALKNVLGSLINLVAAVVFTCSGLIDWQKMGIMTVGALAGYWLGAHYSQRLPQIAVRRLITGIGFAMSAVTFWKQFHH
ncbi:protein of unknown function DUF81 [Chthoniobacter flavus Ellin428]|uniref:Probable membrane transporter protein n=1 Tax=Chthoniobacter flavus Ellin428 TaxID=497964 RepID=B4D544_9BACT|nr:sulfite exporter TauE/SafE family protein [Chthoniobacter flavus]EDY18249.1 protein of unknown function DUF81 [Chthoniobacter flavus Ellin428]TCO91279.1 hypothetical protein EV701_1084 [Chthoniobacter flavus]